MSQSRDDRSGRCWGCGYLLRGIDSGKCPECGREFDRADRASMNFGRPMGGFGRWMLSPLGPWSLGISIVAMGLVLATARWPASGWRFSFLDLRYYGQVWEWKARWAGMTWVDLMYQMGLVLGALAAMGWMLRLALRGYALARYRPPAFQRGRFWRRSLLLITVMLCTVGGMGAGWPFRLGQRWAANVVDQEKLQALRQWPMVGGLRPLSMTPEEELAAIRAAVKQGVNRRARIEGLKLLIEEREPEAAAILAETIASESDGDVKRLEARLLGITGGQGYGKLLLDLLNDPKPEAREGAADGIGIWRDASYSLYYYDDWLGPQIPTDPPIRINLRNRTQHTELPGTREALEKLMLGGSTAGEREAAARALLIWPPPYRLRYAEWGVFMADSAGKLQFVKEQLDEIPPFVHRIGNPTRELEQRVTSSVDVLKPVIHLTSSVPMVVDLQVCIDRGRPWVAYPKIDDLALTLSAQSWTALKSGEPKLQPLDPVGMAGMNDLREGYPWIMPEHRSYSWNAFPRSGASEAANKFDPIGGIGVRWQSLIVSPQKLDWMKPADVVDPRFGWWKRLRDVECSWVSSRGESERFLYYDGPSLRPAPVKVAINKERQEISGIGRNRPGFYIEVTASGVAMVQIEQADPLRPIYIAGLAQPTPTPKAELTRSLVSRGLTPSEAAGLVDCWNPAFFKVPGRRFLTLMTSAEYDEACPMTIRPQPTEKVRVGIIWTELGP